MDTLFVFLLVVAVILLGIIAFILLLAYLDRVADKRDYEDREGAIWPE